MDDFSHSPFEDAHQRRPAPSFSGWIVLAVLVLAGWLAFHLVGRLWQPPLHDVTAKPRPVTPRGDLAADEKATIELYKQSLPSVVQIISLAVRRDALSFNIFEIPQGMGSGFIWDSDGHVVTNFHVIQGAQAAKVKLWNQSSWNARLVGVAPDKDIAVLKIDAPASQLRPIPVGRSADLQVGQKVFAIGNPFGLNGTLTTGVISGLDREIESVTQRRIQGVIQTDAAINPGNSGGPLLDSSGRLVGINTAIYSPSGAYAGVGFAVPVDTVNRIVPQLIRTGRIERAGLGIYIFDDATVQALGLEGVLVRGVVDGGPAEKAGILPPHRDADGRIVADLIVAIDGEPIRSSDDLFDVLEKKQVGQTVSVTVRRGEQTLSFDVVLTALPEMSP